MECLCDASVKHSQISNLDCTEDCENQFFSPRQSVEVRGNLFLSPQGRQEKSEFERSLKHPQSRIAFVWRQANIVNRNPGTPNGIAPKNDFVSCK
jgi:hypothetical protein